MKALFFVISIILPTIVFSADSYNPKTGIVHIPSVTVDSDVYEVEMIHQGNLVFKVTSAIPISEYSEYSEYSDTFDFTSNILKMPSVLVGSDNYKVEMLHQGDLVFEVTTAVPADIKTGIFLDGQVEGLDYRTSSGLSGVTNINGEFTYREGDEITFYLGDLSLTTLQARKIISILQYNNGTNLAAVLIALDEDKNPENGIKLTREIVSQFDQSISFTSEQLDAESSEFKSTFQLLTGRDLPPQHVAYNHASDALKIELLKESEAILYDYATGQIASESLLANFPDYGDAHIAMQSNVFNRINLYSYFHLALPDILSQMSLITNNFDNIDKSHEIINNAVSDTGKIATGLWAAGHVLVDPSWNTGLKEEVDFVIGELKSAALTDVEKKLPVLGAFAKRALLMADNCIPKPKGNRVEEIIKCTTEMTFQAVNTINDSVAAARYAIGIEKLNRYIVLRAILETYYKASRNWNWVDNYYGYIPDQSSSTNSQMLKRIEHIAEKTLATENSIFNIILTPSIDFDRDDAEAVLRMFEITDDDIILYSNRLIQKFGLDKGYDPINDIVSAGSASLTKLEITNDGILKACHNVSNNTGYQLEVEYSYKVENGLDSPVEKEGIQIINRWVKGKEACFNLITGINNTAMHAVELSINLIIEGRVIETFNFDRVVVRDYRDFDDAIERAIKAQVPIIDSFDIMRDGQSLGMNAIVSDANFERAIDFDERFSSSWQQITGAKQISFLDDSQKDRLAIIQFPTDINGCYAFEYTITNKLSGSSDSDQLLINMDDIGAPCEDEDPDAIDSNAPTIILNGVSNVVLSKGEQYQELGATASDETDGTVPVSISGNVDTNTVGKYIVTYTATDKAGNTAVKQRTIDVLETIEVKIVSYPAENTPKDSCINYSAKGCEVEVTTGDSFYKSWQFTNISNMDLVGVKVVTLDAPADVNITLASSINSIITSNSASLFGVDITIPSDLAVGTYQILYKLAENGNDLHYANGEIAYFWFKFKVVDNSPTTPPAITGLSPLQATKGQSTTYTVTGTNLPSTIAMSLSGASCGSPYSVTSTSAKLDCTHGVAGSHQFYIAPVSGQSAISGAESLYVNIEDVEIPIITGLSPLQATKGQSTTYTVTGTNLPSTIAMSLSGASCGSPYSVTSTSAKLDCTHGVAGSHQFYIAPVSGQSAISGAESLYVNIKDVEVIDGIPSISFNSVNNQSFASDFNLSVTATDDIGLSLIDGAVYTSSWVYTGVEFGSNVSGTSSTKTYVVNITSLDAGDYKIKLLAEDSSGQVSSEIYFNFTKETVVTTVSNIDASDGIYIDKVRITWSPTNGASSYLVYRCLNVLTTSCSQIGNVSTTSYDDFGILPNTIYYYRIKSVGTNNTSDFSDYDAGELSSQASIPTTNAPSATDGTYPDQISVSWNSVAGADILYRVYRCSTSSTSSCNLVSTRTNTSFNDKTSNGVELNTTYYYRIRILAGTTEGDFSDYDTGFLGTVASTVQPPVASQGSFGDRVNISWIHVSGAIKYEIYACDTFSVYPEEVLNSASCRIVTTQSAFSGDDGSIVTQTDDRFVTPGVKYWYYVRAENSVGWGEFSEKSNSGYAGLDMPLVPTVYTATRSSWIDITINAPGSHGAERYDIYRCSSELVDSCVLIYGLSPYGVYNDAEIAPDTDYYYRAKSVSYTGNSSEFSAYSVGRL